MIQTARIPQYRRWLAGALAIMLGLGPLATPSYAALTLLADQPLSAQNQAKPNIVLTVDDSTSMLFDYLPDSVIGTFCRGMTGAMSANCGTPGNYVRTVYVTPGHTFQQYGLPFSATNPAFDASGPGAGCDTPNRCRISGAVCNSPSPNVCATNDVACSLLTGPTPCGAGEGACGTGALCSAGINPALTPAVPATSPLYPGIERYPAGTSPKAGQPYEYWTLWPAPAHNSELNHIYYNPRAQYDPPLKADGTPYPQMTNWTSVPADPWATSVQYVDLTAPVTVGLWCNSDWSVGHENDPSYCRTNGTGANAATSSTSSADGDYSYPWAPPRIDLASPPTIAKSIAFSKLDPANWATAKDPKYFYENDNILWCDATHPLWPHQGPLTDQSCIDGSSRLQTCDNRLPQTCGTQPPCVGGAPDTCGGAQSQTCGSLMAQTCGAPTAQTCVPPVSQTCDGIGTQTCDATSSQTCIAAPSPVCNVVAATCVPPNPDTCTTRWEPPDVCPCTGNECPACTPVTTCPPGKCSSNNADCQPTDTCPSSGTCSTNAQIPCQVNGQCPTLSGHCSIDTAVQCQDNSACTNAGHCNLVGNVCHSDTDCQTQPGRCTIDRAACFNDASCLRSGHCSANSTACTTDQQCQPVGGTCTIDGRACAVDNDCGMASHCSIQTTVACHVAGPDPAECPVAPGTCRNSTTACTVDGDCPLAGGHCNGSTVACTQTSDCPYIDLNCIGPDGMVKACTPTVFSPICKLDLQTTCNEPSYCPMLGGNCSITGEPCPTFDASHRYPFPTYDIVLCDPVLTAGHCSVDTNTVCFGPNDGRCPRTNGPSASATCSDMLSDNSKSLREDADTGQGVVCRHNNRAGGYGSEPYDYPSGKFITPVTAGTGLNACVASPRYATVPRHYWKTGLEWCDAVITTEGNKWLGYGKRAPDSTCQDAQDATHIYPRFYQFGQPRTTDNDTTPAFQRMDLIPGATYTHNWTDDNGPEHISRSFAEEMTNYANWFAYYRTRIQAVKTVTSASFSEIDAKYRVGFHAMFSLPSFLNVADFDNTQKPAWFAKLFGVTIPLGQETPTLTSLARIGDYFLNGRHPDLSGSTDPIQLSCQQNFHMLFTDGFTNQGALPTTIVGNVDLTVPAGSVLGAFPIGLTANPIVGITQGSDWPRPYREDPGAATPTLNALSDYAMAYWVTNLRPGPTAACPLCGAPNVPTSNTPPLAGDRYSAKWQHLNFAALSLGTSGKLPAANQVAVETDLRNPAGLLQWPQPKDSLGRPDVLTPDNSGVDDLWHAAINGHGDFVNADSIDEVKLGIGKILAGVGNLPGTATSVGFVSNTFGASADFIYRVRFEQSWSGSLAKIRIDPTTGAVLLVPPPPIWNASDQLIAATTPADGWRTGRRIVTMNESGVSVPFLWDSLGANQRDSLAPGKPAARSQLILQFLRGDRSREGEKVGQLRVRTSPMGDIVDSSPVYVGAPSAPYVDVSDPGYSGFKNTFATRLPHLYVGGNDGMLHAFDDATGNERWAYVPTPLFRGGTAKTLPPVPNDPKTGLGALAYQDGALPAFRHHFYVDSTPKIVDVDLNAPVGDKWRTLLVGGLGKGGNRYYALNVTDPAAVVDEATAANQVLWEFPPVGNTTIDMGYTYGKPVIAKTRALFASAPGKGAWLVIVGSGYNNPTGVGQLYFLQASDPTNFKVMSTGVGTPGAPAGLAHPAGYTQDFHNQLAEQLYAGDLLGNFWRFDVSDPTSDTNWPAPGQYAKLTSPVGGSVQPVTTPPEIKIDPNGIDRWVFVGTGKLYDESDLADHQLQTMYAFRDGTASTPSAVPATPIDRTTMGCTPDPCMVPLPATDSTNNFGLATIPPKGWYHDLPAGSRIVVPPQAAVGVIAYIATKAPSADLCVIGLPVTVYARDYGTGQSLLTASFDGTGALVPGIDIAEGGVGLQIVIFPPADGGASSTPDVRLAITMPDGTVLYIKPKFQPASFQHRMSWRLLGQ
jgi:type IV pilus assembly protein PilY1